MNFSDIVRIYKEYSNLKGIPLSEESSKKEILDFIGNEEFLNDKPRIILVSKEFRPEVTASVLWLRKFGLDITCVKITPYKIDKNILAFESNILIPLPEARDFVIKTEHKETGEQDNSLTNKSYLDFYNEIIDKIKGKISYTFHPPQPKYYYQISTGIKSVHFEWSFHGRPRNSFAVELHFERRNKDFNVKAIEQFEKLKDIIEKETGEKVEFQPDYRS